jgi:subtilisin family serine protease
MRPSPISEEDGAERSPGFILSKSENPDYGPSFGQLEMLNVPAVHQQGYSGRGVLVLVLDTGFYKNHEAIHPNRIVGEYDFVSNDRNTHNETAEEDSLGHHIHGTQVYSTLGGYGPGKLIGPAYECSFLLAKTEITEYDSIIEEDHFVAALEWGESRGADIISSSVGYLDWYQPDALDGNTAITTRAVRWATRMGMVAVIAVGNERRNTSWGGNVVVPADADSIISVGAVTTDGSIAMFSSHGPTFDGRIKPELVAQGMLVTCAAARDSAAYTVSNGTSYSAPLVAGSAALLLEAHPNWGPMDVRGALLATASQAGNPNNDYGWGIPDVLAALNYEVDGPADEDTPVLTHVYPNPLNPGGHRGQLTVRWIGPYASPVSLDIYNVLGQHILCLYSPHEKALGLGTATWSGYDARGKSLPSGIYMLRLTTGNKTITKRITLLR